MQENYAALIGYAVGNGWISAERRFEFVTNRQEESLANTLCATLNLLRTDLGSKTSVGVLRRPGRQILYAKTRQQSVLEYMKSFAVLDKYAPNKKFTDRFLALDSQYKRAAIRGLFSADGTVGPRQISLATSSEILAHQVIFLLQEEGIDARLSVYHRPLPNRSPEYSVRIYGKNRRLFADHIGFIPESKKTTKLEETLKAHPPRMNIAARAHD